MREALTLVTRGRPFQPGHKLSTGCPKRRKLTNDERAFVRFHAQEMGFSSAAIARRMRQEKGYDGRTEQVRRYVDTIRRELQRESLRAEAVVVARLPPPWWAVIPLQDFRTMLQAQSDAAMAMYRQHIATRL